MSVPTPAAYDYIAKEGPEGLHLVVRGYSFPLMALAIGLGGFFTPILLFIGLAALGMSTGRSGGTIVALAIGIAALAFFIGSRKVAARLLVTPSSLTARGQTYQLDDVSAIGLDSPGAEGAIYTGINAAGSILGQYVNNVLTITYGTRRIVILGGQTPESIRGVRSIILGYLRKHERQYGNANDNDVANYEAAALRGQSQNIDIGNGWGSSELRHLLKIRWLAVALVSLIIGFIGIAWRALDVGFNGNTLNFVTVVLVASTAVFVAISIAIVGIRALMLLVKPTS